MQEEPKDSSDSAIQAAQQAIAEAERIFGQDDLIVAERLEDLAHLYKERSQTLQAANVLARARAIRHRFGQVDDAFYPAGRPAGTSQDNPPQPQWRRALSVASACFLSEARQWCQGRSCWIRLPLLLFFAYLFVQYLVNPQYNSIFMGLNLGIHEMGHAMFMPLGWLFPNEFMHFVIVAAGSGVQCLVPIGSMLMFLLQRDFFGIAVAFGWLSTNLFSVSLYAGDARSRELPLVSPFGSVDVDGHDWYYMLSTTGLLQADQFIAGFLRLLGITAMIVCLVFGAWLLNIMRTSKKKRSFSEDALLNVYGAKLLAQRRQLAQEEKSSGEG